jgi:hypothetical protein
MVRRVLLDADDDAVRALAGSVTIPATSVKGFMESAELARLLTPDWTPDPPGVQMATALRPGDVHTGSGPRPSISGTDWAVPSWRHCPQPRRP